MERQRQGHRGVPERRNPNWRKQDVEAMLQKQLDLTTGEVVGRLKKD